MHAYKLTYYIAYPDGSRSMEITTEAIYHGTTADEAWQDFLNTRGCWHPIDAAKRFKFVAAEIAV